MTQRVPSHHLKQKICATRPAYREGRNPKAVKVYTVNNESKYVIIQGVPSVGATNELIKLCSSYGEVEEHHALDEYPCEDKYTEVYLIKYKKIQSARFCKRKLDDHSFFGGNLHVCYAPEHETIPETRAKLQDRRRVIAGKIRQLKNEKVSETVSLEACLSQEGNSFDSSFHQPDEKDCHNPAFQSIPNITQSSRDAFEVIGSDNSLSQVQPSNSSQQEIVNHSSLCNSPSVTFELPPPPSHSSHVPLESIKKYEYSRVPSKHSTLPLDFDGRLKYDTQLHETQNQKNKSILSNKTVKIDKNYKPSKPTLKFIPRQAIKRPLEDKTDPLKSGSADDTNSKDIRKQAFILSNEQGPVDLPGRKEVEQEITPGASSSYRETIRTIRSKITKVITDVVSSKQ